MTGPGLGLLGKKLGSSDIHQFVFAAQFLYEKQLPRKVQLRVAISNLDGGPEVKRSEDGLYWSGLPLCRQSRKAE